MLLGPTQHKWQERDFIIVDWLSANNTIIRGPTLIAWTFMSTYHLTFKFPTECVVREAQRNQLVAQECHLTMPEIDRQLWNQ